MQGIGLDPETAIGGGRDLEFLVTVVEKIAALAEVAHALETEIKRVPGTRDVYTIGAPDRVVSVTLDPAKLASYGLTVADLGQALRAANAVQQVGERVGDGRTVPVTAGTFLASADEVRDLVIGLSGPYDFFPFTSDSARNAFGHVADPAMTQPIVIDAISGTTEKAVMASAAKRIILLSGYLLSPAARACRS